MKRLEHDQVEQVTGGLDPRQSETQVAPDPATNDPIVDYNPPQQPQ